MERWIRTYTGRHPRKRIVDLGDPLSLLRPRDSIMACVSDYSTSLSLSLLFLPCITSVSFVLLHQTKTKPNRIPKTEYSLFINFIEIKKRKNPSHSIPLTIDFETLLNSMRVVGGRFQPI